MSVSFVIPAKNEHATIQAVAFAACVVADLLHGSVVVVADHCSDGTADEADKAGARVLELKDGAASKSSAVAAGIREVGTDHVCLLDADCIGLTPEAIMRLVQPVTRGAALMSVATLDYGQLSRLVASMPWSTGLRAFPTQLFPMDDPRLHGYNLELLLNEAVGRHEGITMSQTLRGLHQRSKLVKLGLTAGIRANVRMWTAISEAAEQVDPQAYKRYIDGIVIERNGEWRPPSRVMTLSAHRVLTGVGRGLRGYSRCCDPIRCTTRPIAKPSPSRNWREQQ